MPDAFHEVRLDADWLTDRVLKFGLFAMMVDIFLRDRYGLSWHDSCGDLQPLARAYDGGEDAAEFVERYATRYDLDPVEHRPGGPRR